MSAGVGRSCYTYSMKTNCEMWFWYDSTVWKWIVDPVRSRWRRHDVLRSKACVGPDVAWRVVLVRVEGWGGGFGGA